MQFLDLQQVIAIGLCGCKELLFNELAEFQFMNELSG